MNIDQILKKIKKFIPRSLFSFFQPAYHFFISFFAAALYGFPSRRLIVLGVTGTKGKTTVIELTREILKEAGAQVASLSSVRFQIGEKEEPNMRKMTMPGRFFVQKFLYDAVRAGCKYAVLEVTSEGVKQFRHRFIRFRAAAATNVAPEHIESHGNFEKYLRAKLDLFWRLPPDGSAIINQDDPAAERFAAATTARRITYGKDGIEINGKTLAARDILINGEGTAFEINGTTFSSKLLGEFNLYNIFCAVALGLSQHTALGKIARAVARVNLIPGRMEFIPAFVKTSAGEQKEFTVVVDYAHTPDSLRKVYQTLREPVTSNQLLQVRKLICVLGSAGGGRDKWKRPELGKIAAEFCSRVILTNEDPYDENPDQILSDIKSGVTSNQLLVTSIPDRREAIRMALRQAQAGDIVVITGKGAEPWIAGPRGTKIPWNDKEIVGEELARLK